MPRWSKRKYFKVLFLKFQPLIFVPEFGFLFYKIHFGLLKQKTPVLTYVRDYLRWVLVCVVYAKRLVTATQIEINEVNREYNKRKG